MFTRSIIASLMTVATFLTMMGVVKPDASQGFDPLGKLEIWQGHWTYRGQIFETRYSHARSDSGTFDCNWMQSSGYMVCEYNSADPPHNDLSIFNYNPVTKAYAHVEVTKDSKPTWEPVSRNGNTWTTSTDVPYKGKTMVYQVVFTFDSAHKQITTVRLSGDNGQNWVTVARTTAVRK